MSAAPSSPCNSLEAVKAYLAVAVGGFFGTGLRLTADLALPHADAGFPTSTLLVNLVGAFVLGILVAGLWRRPSIPQWFKAGIGPGLLGSFTTLSAVMGSLVFLTRAGEWWLGAVYLAVSVVAGLGAAALGLFLGSRLHPPMPREIPDEGRTQ